MKCPRCSEPYAEQDRFCPACGAPLETPAGVPWWKRRAVWFAVAALAAVAGLGLAAALVFTGPPEAGEDEAARLSIPAPAQPGVADGGPAPSPGRTLGDEVRPDAIRGEVIELGRRSLKVRSLSTRQVYELERGRRTQVVPRHRLQVGERVVVTYRIGFRGRLSATRIARD